MRLVGKSLFVLLNARGAGLAETVIAIGVLGAVATAGFSLSSTSAQISKTIHQKNQAQAITDLLKLSTENSTQCAYTFGPSEFNIAGATLPSDVNAGWRLGGDSNGHEIDAYIANLGAGPAESSNRLTSDETGNANYLPRAGLKIDSFKIKDAIAKCAEDGLPAGLPACPKTGEQEFIGRLSIQFSPIKGGRTMRPQVMSGLVFTVDTTSNPYKIKNCRSSFSKTEQDVCKEYGPNCVYNPAITDGQPCDCPEEPDIGCPRAGQFWTGTINGVVQCKELGGGRCPPGHVLTGVGLGSIQCMPLNSINVSFASSSSSVTKGSGGSVQLKISEAQLEPTVVTIAVTNPSSALITTTPATTDGVITLTIPASSNSASFSYTTSTEAAAPDKTVTFTITSVSTLKDVVVGFPNTHALTLLQPDCGVVANATWTKGGNNCQGSNAVISIPKGTTHSGITSTNGNIGFIKYQCSATGVRSINDWECDPPIPVTCDCADAFTTASFTPGMNIIPENSVCGWNNGSTVRVYYYCNSSGALVDISGTPGHSCYSTAESQLDNFVGTGTMIGIMTLVQLRVANCP
jgi:hypothetical protein